LFNLLPPFLFMLAVMIPSSQFLPWLHFWITVIVIIASFVSFVVLGGIWIFDCNLLGGTASICADYRWCCVNYASAPEYCPNVGPCPGITSSDLSANGEFLQHFGFSIAFWVLGGIALWLNFRMRKYGVFFETI